MKSLKKLIYLDHAATTPVDPRVLKAMQPFWSDKFANPSALYKSGREALNAINQARADIAQILNSKPNEIIFTAGGTESNNLAIFGAAQAYEKTHGKPGHIITTTIEHHSVLHAVEALKQDGWKVSFAKTDGEGFVSLPEMKKLANKDTALISVMYANNEVGTIEPIEEIGKWVNGLNKVRAQKKLPNILFHTDACQAGGALPLNTHNLKVDLLTLNGSKIYGPKQTGILFVREGVKLEPIIHGGGQERDLRSGTENVPGIIGLATALQFAQKDLAKESKRLKALQNYLVSKIKKEFKDSVLNGPELKTDKRLPNNVNLTFKNVEGETLMLYLDAAGIAVSTGSACATTSLDPSHVLVAIGVPKKEAYNAIRITMGKTTTKADLDYFIKKLKETLKIIGKTN